MNNFKKEYIKFLNKNRSVLIGLTHASKIKEFLRTLPRGKVFSRSQIEEYVRLKNLAIPVDELINYGNDCNWLTREGKSFFNCAVFCNCYNGVYLEEQRNLINMV